jgi:large subunit ribosomal protein L15
MAVVNVGTLEKFFEAGATITAEDLIKKHLAKKLRGGVKLLGNGEVTKAFHVIVQAVSPSAKQKIESAGGTVTIQSIKEETSEKKQNT